jgi:hypothetical protein
MAVVLMWEVFDNGCVDIILLIGLAGGYCRNLASMALIFS